MTPNHKDIPWLEKSFFENQEKFPPDELAKYAGQCVAWSWDGSQILASAEDMDALERNLLALGIDPARVVESYIPPPDTVLLL
jgi:hypothetical protein